MNSVEVFVQRRFRCGACRKSWTTKKTAAEHVYRGCHKDPATRTCATCAHFEPGYSLCPITEGGGDIPAGCNVDNPDFNGEDSPVEWPRSCEFWELAR